MQWIFLCAVCLLLVYKCLSKAKPLHKPTGIGQESFSGSAQTLIYNSLVKHAQNEFTSAVTYREILYSAQKLNIHLQKMGLEKVLVPKIQNQVANRKKGDKIGVLAPNSVDFVVCMITCSLYGYVLVPINENQDRDLIKYIIQHSGCKLILVYEVWKSKLPEDVSSTILISVKNSLLVSSKSNDELLLPELSSSTVFFIIYTSGTTGVPKGVMLTHGNIYASLKSLEISRPLLASDVHLSYLPMAHIYENITVLYLIAVGARLIFGKKEDIISSITDKSITVLFAVPRVITKLCSETVSNMASSTNLILRFGIAIQQHLRVPPSRNPLFHVLKMLCPSRNLRMVVCGAAPLPEYHHILCTWLFGPVVIGYGLTESTAPAFSSVLSDYSTGHVGYPLPCNEFKLVPVKEFERGLGEVCLRGYNIMKGYYKDPQQTIESIDSEGWLHTGDVGKINANGQLIIVSRLKSVFKLAQGVFIAPEPLEKKYLESQWVEQIFVYGDGTKEFLIAIVVPSTRIDEMKHFTETQQKMSILKELQSLAKQAKYNSLHVVKNCFLETTIKWTPDNGMTTPSMKIKRHALFNKYKKVIESLYAEGSLPI